MGDGSQVKVVAEHGEKGIDLGIQCTLGGRTLLMSRIYDNDSYQSCRQILQNHKHSRITRLCPSELVCPHVSCSGQ